MIRPGSFIRFVDAHSWASAASFSDEITGGFAEEANIWRMNVDMAVARTSHSLSVAIGACRVMVDLDGLACGWPGHV